MIILDTVAHETIWGGQRLMPFAKGEHPNIGHLYSLCCEKGLENHILNGKFKGKVFQEYFLSVRDKYGLSMYDEFPLIIALVEPKMDLSIQVHPDDQMAVNEEHAQYGKNESWYFLDTPESREIYNGCLAASKEEFREKMEQNDVLSVVDRLPVKKGDYVYVEAGTIHALSSGCLLYEIEENSPWTYRIYDYNRIDSEGNKRELHVEKALRALKPQLKSKAYPMGDSPIEERRYVVQRIIYANEYTNVSKTLECITMIEGKCIIENISFTTGTTVVLEPGETLVGDIRHAVMARPK
ncbi:type I phosphomannose isomerase catalytic subunit [Butyrivibrio sp. AE3004]|uniref:type I phosphomannose isomerase catalytic subunit n=1 Tax=Butyrivibrio sp. AE3004 TaxID=1506994 RepID=UPI00068E7BC8|nr:type I phosphomannose isomerase catalytic subunit [Butyrivibrio sp. AE3004]